MPDDIKRVQVDITSTYDGRGAAAAAADQEKLFGMQGKAKFDPNLPLFTSKVAAAQQELTNTGRGLATSLPDLSAATQQYVITEEAEYIAVQKAHEALMKRLPVLQAAGKDTAEYQRTLESLSAALSTNEALTIAETMEAKAAAEAQLAKAAATDAATASADASVIAGRKMVSLFDEISRGQRGQVFSTLGSLLNVFGPGGPFTLGILGTGSAVYALYRHLENVNEEVEKLRRQWAQIDARVWDDQATAIGDAARAAQRYLDATNEVLQKQDKWRENTAEQSAELADQKSEIDAILDAEEERDLERAKGDPVQEEAIRRKYEALRKEAEIEAQIAKVEADQDNLAKARAAATTAKAARDSAAMALKNAVKPEAVSEAEAKKDLLKGRRETADVAFQDEMGGEDMPEAITALRSLQDYVKRFGSEAQNPSYIATPSGPVITEAGETRLDLQKAEKLFAATQAAEKAITDNNKIVDDYAQHMLDLNDAAKTAGEDFDQRQQDLQEGEERLRDDQQSLNSKRFIQSVVGSIEKGVNPQTIQGAADAERDYFTSRAQNLNEKQAQMLNLFKSTLDGAHANTALILQLLSQMVQAHKSDRQIIEFLSHQISQNGNTFGTSG